MKVSNPYTSMNAKMAPETVSSQLSANKGKATARYPSKPRTNQPAGGGTVGGSHTKAAATPGGPAGS